jgi:hypothetical protein
MKGRLLVYIIDIEECYVLRLLVIAIVVPSSPILVSLMMAAMCSTETLIHTRATAVKTSNLT